MLVLDILCLSLFVFLLGFILLVPQFLLWSKLFPFFLFFDGDFDYLTIGVGIHFLTHLRLNYFQFGLLDELSEGIYFLLIEKGDKVVAESTHLAISLKE